MTAAVASREEVEAVMKMAIQACASARHELNALEQTAWMAAIETFGAQSTVRFLQEWVSTNSRKAPTVGDLRRSLDPNFLECDAALERLYLLVTTVGPYEAPTAETVGATLCRVIENLGGWARINEMMPDRGSDRFAWSAFAERFSTAFGTARTQEFQATLLPPEARRMLQRPVGLHEISRDKAAEIALLRSEAAATVQLPRP